MLTALSRQFQLEFLNAVDFTCAEIPNQSNLSILKSLLTLTIERQLIDLSNRIYSAVGVIRRARTSVPFHLLTREFVGEKRNQFR